jgi:hypothetical protein
LPTHRRIYASGLQINLKKQIIRGGLKEMTLDEHTSMMAMFARQACQIKVLFEVCMERTQREQEEDEPLYGDWH